MALVVATLDKEKEISFSVKVGSEKTVKDERICQNIDKISGQWSVASGQ
ncbi:MAG: hypothetical protein HY790_07445 [Deltaproteobacteria bacterium]|nr:hypothetical protein [Deltaproteobacteria bacterium]